MQRRGSCTDGSCQSLGCGTQVPCGKLGCAGPAPAVPCDIAALEKECTANPHCGGFNTDGWLKGCVSTDCGADQHSIPGVDLCKFEAHHPAATTTTTWTTWTPLPRPYFLRASQGGVQRSAASRWPGGALDLSGMGAACCRLRNEPTWPGGTVSRSRLLICCTAREVYPA